MPFHAANSPTFSFRYRQYSALATEKITTVSFKGLQYACVAWETTDTIFFIISTICICGTPYKQPTENHPSKLKIMTPKHQMKYIKDQEGYCSYCCPVFTVQPCREPCTCVLRGADAVAVAFLVHWSCWPGGGQPPVCGEGVSWYGGVRSVEGPLTSIAVASCGSGFGTPPCGRICDW